MSPPTAPAIARDVFTRRWFRIEAEGGRVIEVAEAEPPASPPAPTFWIAYALWDIQTNGRWGRSYSDPSLTVDEVVAIVRAQAELGTARLCPTLITAPFEAMRHGVATIAAACERDPAVGRMVAGIHLEGPAISGLEGYRGAHPPSSIRDPDWDEFCRLQVASGGRVRLVTLAPERPGAIRFIERATAERVTVALGHTAADPATLDAAATAGARLSTHLGNGIAALLPRHPNPIWVQAADARLAASLIADGHHLDRSVLKVLLSAKGMGHCVLVSDASPLAGLPPGAYGDWEVEPDGRVAVAGTPYLAGSTRDLPFAINEVLSCLPGCSPESPIAMASIVPATVLGFPEPGYGDYTATTSFILFRLEGGRFRLEGTSVDGRWVPRGEGTRPGA